MRRATVFGSNRAARERSGRPAVPRALLIPGLIAALLASATATGCGNGVPEKSDRAFAVTTIPPFAMILRPVLEPDVRVETLLRPGITPHTYDPRPSDVRAVERSRVLAYGSPLLDGWARDLPNTRPLGLVDLLPDTLRRPPPGSAERGEGLAADRADPHFWTDPLAVRSLLPALADTLCALRAAPCAELRERARAFSDELLDLHRTVRDTTAPARGRPVLLAQPFFGFFLRRYDVPIAGVVEPSPGNEPGSRHVERLIQLARERGIETILASSAESPRLAEIVARATGARVVTVRTLGTGEGIGSYRELILDYARTVREAVHDATAIDA